MLQYRFGPFSGFSGYFSCQGTVAQLLLPASLEHLQCKWRLLLSPIHAAAFPLFSSQSHYQVTRYFSIPFSANVLIYLWKGRGKRLYKTREQIFMFTGKESVSRTGATEHGGWVSIHLPELFSFWILYFTHDVESNACSASWSWLSSFLG